MPRLTPITKREQVTGDGLTAFDAIIASRGSINAPQSMHLYVPEIAQCSTALSDALRYRSHLSDHDTELAIITAAREMDCDYVWSGHYTMMSCTLIATDYRPAEGAPVLPKRAEMS
ncbi:MAG TPA: hypothetical protein VFR55_00935 [Dehalococcoidia bacterium]|nr:hypothetical protein [Dehalococcoidia bacterium]